MNNNKSSATLIASLKDVDNAETLSSFESSSSLSYSSTWLRALLEITISWSSSLQFSSSSNVADVGISSSALIYSVPDKNLNQIDTPFLLDSHLVCIGFMEIRNI